MWGNVALVEGVYLHLSEVPISLGWEQEAGV